MAKTAAGSMKIILKWIGRGSCAVTELGRAYKLFNFRVVLPAGGRLLCTVLSYSVLCSWKHLLFSSSVFTALQSS